MSQRAIVRLYLDKRTEAMADADEAVRLERSELRTRIFVALHSGAYATAIEDATDYLLFLTDDADRAIVYASRGLARAEAGDTEGAIDDLTEALALDPDLAAAYDRRAYAHYLRGDLSAAEADFARAQERLSTLGEQQRAELAYHRALLLRAQGASSRAGAELGEAASLARLPLWQQRIDAARSAPEG